MCIFSPRITHLQNIKEKWAMAENSGVLNSLSLHRLLRRFLVSNCWRLNLALKNQKKIALEIETSPPSSCRSTTSPAVDWSLDVTTAVVKCFLRNFLVKILEKSRGKWLPSTCRWSNSLRWSIYLTWPFFVRFCWVRWLQTIACLLWG